MVLYPLFLTLLFHCSYSCLPLGCNTNNPTTLQSITSSSFFFFYLLFRPVEIKWYCSCERTLYILGSVNIYIPPQKSWQSVVGCAWAQSTLRSFGLVAPGLSWSRGSRLPACWTESRRKKTIRTPMQMRSISIYTLTVSIPKQDTTLWGEKKNSPKKNTRGKYDALVSSHVQGAWCHMSRKKMPWNGAHHTRMLA